MGASHEEALFLAVPQPNPSPEGLAYAHKLIHRGVQTWCASRKAVGRAAGARLRRSTAVRALAARTAQLTARLGLHRRAPAALPTAMQPTVLVCGCLKVRLPGNEVEFSRCVPEMSAARAGRLSPAAPLWRRASQESRVGPRQRTSEGAICAMARSALLHKSTRSVPSIPRSTGDPEAQRRGATVKRPGRAALPGESRPALAREVSPKTARTHRKLQPRGSAMTGQLVCIR